MQGYKFRDPLFFFKINLQILIPCLLFMHGINWTVYLSSGVNILNPDNIIYTIKILSFLFLLHNLFIYGGKPFLYVNNIKIIVIFLTISFVGLLNPIIGFDEINIFYYLSDFLGIVVLFWSIILFNYLFKYSIVQIQDIFQILINSSFFISISIIINFIISGGGKISIPPEIHYHLAILFSSIGLGYSRKIISKSNFIVIFSGAIISLMRIYPIILICSYSISFFYAVIINKGKGFVNQLVIISVVSSLTLLFFGQILNNRIESLKLSNDFGDSDEIVFDDPSANQRFVEASLILFEFEKMPIYFKIFGKGFGAEYGNNNNQPYISGRKHHSHMAPVSILFRNGIFGLIIFIIPFFRIIGGCFSKKHLIHILSIGGLMTYFALLTDQYVYWGLIFGLTISTILSFKAIKNTVN